MKETNPLIKGSCIRTFTGKYLDVFNPDPEMICIEDIAHSLSHQCRFAGHTNVFYSVAQHSVDVWQISSLKKLPIDIRLQALMHDASEAYLLDIPSPIKNALPEYKELENNLMLLIAEKFGFDYPLSEEVKRIDKLQLRSEWLSMMTNHLNLLPWSPEEAKEIFLETYTRLNNYKKHL